MNYLRRLPLRPAATAALTALFALAAPSLSPVASAQEAATKTPAGPNGKIVFESDQAGDPGINDIYTMDANGRHQTRLTTDPAHDGSAVWSPDGSRIAFISSRRGVFEIYLMNADGSNQRPLRAEGVKTFEPIEWSPDGTRLAYVDGGEACVVEAVAPGGGDSVVPPWSVSGEKLANSSDIGVSWSPTGTRLVIRNAEAACGGCSDLYTVNADGTGRTKLSTGAGFDTEPRWSPDGTRVAYEGDRNGRAIYVTNADGTGTETLLSGTVGSFGGPEWSPDGTRLVFSSLLGVIHVVNANGSGLTALNEQTPTGSSGPFWSPDGQKVAYQESGDIFVVNADGSSRRASNYTKTRRADEFASSWQRIATP